MRSPYSHLVFRFAVFLSLSLGFLWLDKAQGDAGKAASSSKPGVAKKAAPEKIVISTTHAIRLKNGKVIRACLVKKEGGFVELSLKPFGTFRIPEAEIAEIKAEPGKIVLTRPKPGFARKPSKKAAPRPKTAEKALSKTAPQLRPPAVPPEKQKEILRWVYHLTSSNPKWRVRAERHLKAMGPVVISAVLPYTRYPRWLVRAAAYRVLGATGHPSAVPALFEGLDDSVPMVRQAAYESLKKLTGCRLSFDPQGPPAARKRDRKRWEAWLRKRGLLPEADPASKP